MNPNTRAYWNERFKSGAWERSLGRDQTRKFAKEQVGRFDLQAGFQGSLLDFGCGLGDAIPVYRGALPGAKLIGWDISDAGIEKCRRSYGDLAEFHQGDHRSVPAVDVIVASNVLEHLSGDVEVVEALLARCSHLFLTVPYCEVLSSGGEHVNSYDDRSFSGLSRHCQKVFPSEGWSEFGWELFFGVHVKNVLKAIAGRPQRGRRLQVMYHLVGKRPGREVVS